MGHTATHCNTLQHTATHCNTLYFSILQHTASHPATHFNTLQHRTWTTHTWYTLQHTATHYTVALQYTVTRTATFTTHCNPRHELFTHVIELFHKCTMTHSPYQLHHPSRHQHCNTHTLVHVTCLSQRLIHVCVSQQMCARDSFIVPVTRLYYLSTALACSIYECQSIFFFGWILTHENDPLICLSRTAHPTNYLTYCIANTATHTHCNTLQHKVRTIHTWDMTLYFIMTQSLYWLHHPLCHQHRSTHTFICVTCLSHMVAKSHRMPYLCRSFSAKKP